MTARVRTALVVVGIVVAILGAAALRVVWQGRSALAEGDAARARGDVAAAIDHWRAAARHYLPVAPHVDAAYDRLATTARAAETAGDPATALAAWRGIRSASRATRGLTTPGSELAAEADRRIAALMAADPDGSPAAGDTPAAREAWHAARLAVVPGPSLGMTLIAALGLAGWLAGLLLFARQRRLRRPVDTSGRFAPGTADGVNRRQAVVALALIVAGAATWSIGLLAA